MENFENSLDLSVFDEMEEKVALNYIKAKFWERALNQVKQSIKWKVYNLTDKKWVHQNFIKTINE